VHDAVEVDRKDAVDVRMNDLGQLVPSLLRTCHGVMHRLLLSILRLLFTPVNLNSTPLEAARSSGTDSNTMTLRHPPMPCLIVQTDISRWAVLCNYAVVHQGRSKGNYGKKCAA
jgi:hypothetical protein